MGGGAIAVILCYEQMRWLIIWCGISMDGCTDLYIIQRSTLMTQRYADKIISSHVVPYTKAFLLMYDNSRPYTAQFVENVYGMETVQRVKGSA